jgi:hypothetical protein
MKTRTLRRLRRALKKRQTHHPKRVLSIADARRASEHFEATLGQNVSAFTRIQRKVSNHFEERARNAGSEVLTRTTGWTPPPPVHEPALYPVEQKVLVVEPKPTGGALLEAMLKGSKP